MNLTAWQSITLLADGLGNGQRSYSSKYGPYHFQQLYHSCLSCFKIITLTVQTDIGEGLNTRGGKGALTSDRKMKKTSLINEPNTRLDSRHSRHWLVQCKRIQCHLCSARNKETRTTYKSRECNIGFCATPCFKVLSHKLHFWEPGDTKMEKRNTQL